MNAVHLPVVHAEHVEVGVRAGEHDETDRDSGLMPDNPMPVLETGRTRECQVCCRR